MNIYLGILLALQSIYVSQNLLSLPFDILNYLLGGGVSNQAPQIPFQTVSLPNQNIAQEPEIQQSNECESIYYRPNIATLPRDQLQRYFNAVNRLNSGRKPTIWDRMTKLHIDQYAKVHSTTQFAAWHRAYLHIVETELQKLDPSVSIPYWDWSVYSQNPTQDQVLSSAVFGGDGDRNNGNCLQNGYFKNFRTMYDGYGNYASHCIRRSFTKRTNNGMIWTAPETIEKLILNAKSFTEFRKNLESGPHGVIHNGIGADFSGHASTADPLFFSHHAFVDKLWFDWQMRNPSMRARYDSDNSEKLFGMDYNIGDVLDAEKDLCYGYKEEHFSWSRNSNINKRDYYVIKTVNHTYTTTTNANSETFIPLANDTTHHLNKLRVPVPFSDDFITKFGLDPKIVRMFEEEQRKLISNLNKDPTYVSEVALSKMRTKA